MFHNKLVTYINTGCFSKGDYALSLVSSSLPFKLNAEKVIRLYNAFDSSDLGKETVVAVDVYKGSNPFVLKMMLHLNEELKDDVYGAYVHGSLATGEEIRYSDFDALIILNNSVFDNPQKLARVALKISRLQCVMFSFDPLQHHGWFVLTEKQLKTYPSTYFPPILFQLSASLLIDKGLAFTIVDEAKQADYSTPFFALAKGLIDRLERVDTPKNSFELKSLLSEFMLLPSLFLQAKNKQAVYKKGSFIHAKLDFEEEDWQIMNQVSSIRAAWDYNPSMLHSKLAKSNAFVIRKIARNIAPKISDRIEKKLTPVFYESMLTFTRLMVNKLKK